jgi:hypothetical protein
LLSRSPLADLTGMLLDQQFREVQKTRDQDLNFRASVEIWRLGSFRPAWETRTGGEKGSGYSQSRLAHRNVS